MLKTIRLWLRNNMEFVLAGLGTVLIGISFAVFMKAVDASIPSYSGAISWVALTVLSGVVFLAGIVVYIIACFIAKRKEGEEEKGRRQRDEEFINKLGGIIPNQIAYDKKPQNKGGNG